MKQPKVSIMMLSYQTVAWLKEAIDSVKAQTYKNWELIILDDNSQDGSYELARACKSSKIKVYRNEKQLGTAGGRAKASKLCTGDFICHLDSDDLIEPWALETMVREFNRRPDVALIYSDWMDIGEDGAFGSYQPSHPYSPDKIAFLGWRPLGMYRRSVMDSIDGYNAALPHCEDGDLFMQIVERFPAAHIPAVLYRRRSHSRNTSRRNVSCGECKSRPICNYVRVWSKHAGYDPITFTSLPKENVVYRPS
jgi:glycosyltransferase involved in cell wall biosynthesis